MTICFLALTVSVHASEDLVKTHKCATCHDKVEKKMGPTWTEISVRHKGGKPAELVKSMIEGSRGKYGKMPMPAQKLSSTDAEALAQWIMSQNSPAPLKGAAK